MSAAGRRTRPGRSSREPASPPARRRGRPPRLSRDQIVDAVLSLIDREPGEPITIARVAAKVGAAPSALYRHFENLDDLLDDVVAKVLAEVDAGPTADAPWEARLEQWLWTLRARLLRVPAVLTLIGRTGRTSPAWLNASSALVEILEQAGLEGDRLALTYLWILETTTGLILQEAAMPLAVQLASAGASHAELDPTATARFEAVAPALESIDGEDFFSFVVQQAIAAVSMQRRRTGRA